MPLKQVLGGVSFFLLVLAWAIYMPTAKGDEPPLSYYVPTSGQMKLHCLNSQVTPSGDVETFDDVMNLWRKLDELELDDETIRSGKFLGQAGFENLVPHPIPPPPGRAPLPVPPVQDWIWTEATVDFDPEHYRVDFEVPRLGEPEIRVRLLTVMGPRSVVSMGLDFRRQVDHWGQGRRILQYNANELFSRSAAKLKDAEILEELDKGQLWSLDRFGPLQTLLWIDPEADAIFARAMVSPRNNRVTQFSLHLNHRETAAPQPHQTPGLTLIFRRSSGAWRLHAYHIEEVDFETPPEKDLFRVTLEPGTLYKGRSLSRARTLVLRYPDILLKTPAEVDELEETAIGLGVR